MSLLFPLLTILEASGAILYLWKPSETGLSLTRLGFVFLIFCITSGLLFGWGWTIKKSNQIRINRLAVNTSSLEVTALISLALGLLCFVIVIASGTYYDNPAVDHAIGYIRQAVPFLIFSGLCLTQLFIAIFYYLAKQEKGIFSTMSRIIRRGRIVWQIILIILACLILMGAFIPVRKNYYPSYDYSIFSYIGQQILKGKVPYLEIWDHKPAVIFYIDALGLFLANGSLMGIWVLEFIALITGALILFKLSSRFFSEAVSLLVTVLGILHYVRLFDFGNYTEEFSLLFQMLALGLYFSSRWRRKPYFRTFLSGVLCALAFTCKQNTIGIWISLFLLELFFTLFVQDDRSRGMKLLMRQGLVFLCGFLLVNGIWAIYFWSKGAIREYWEVAFWYNLVYSEHSTSNRWATGLTTLTFLPGISIFLLLGFIAWPAALTEFIQKLRSHKMHGYEYYSKNRLLLWALISLPVELFFAGLSGMNYQHYFILCIPPVCVLLCWLATKLNSFFVLHLKTRYSFLFVFLLFTAGSLQIIPFYRENFIPRMPSVYTKTADFLKENTDADDPVLIWGGGLASYVIAERSAPTRFFNVRPLYLFPGYVQDEQWTQFLAELKNSPPVYIIYTNESYLAKIPFTETGFCEVSSLADYQKEAYNYLCEYYRFRETINEGMNDAWGVFEFRKGENND